MLTESDDLRYMVRFTSLFLFNISRHNDGYLITG